MEKVVVIGGFGNIGLGVTKALLTDGFDVTVVTLPSKDPSPLPEVKWIQADRKDAAAFQEALSKEKYDYAIDLACFGLADAEMDYRLFRDSQHIVVASSGAVYGPLLGCEIPIKEYTRRLPSWGYGITKKQAEDFFFEKFQQEGFPITVLRPTVVYGRAGMLVRQIGMDNAWVDRIRKGKPIVTGNPYILRNFLYADDAVGAFVGALKHDWCKGQAYNLGSIRGYDWGTYHQTMMEIIGREVEMVEVPLQILQQSPHFEVSPMITTNYIYNGLYDTTKIARDIPEFAPATDLRTGLEKALAYLDERNLIPNSDDYSWEDELIESQRRAAAYLHSLS